MHSYRCYVLDCRYRVAAIKLIECASDVEARQRADALLAQTGEYTSTCWVSSRLPSSAPVNRQREER